jgi:hypothetical protein
MTGAVVMRTSGGLIQRNPTANRIPALVGALSREASLAASDSGSMAEYIIVHLIGSSDDQYIQVWLRPEGVFQLEYRAGKPSEHYQTRTESRDKVVSALSGWSRGESAWRDDFEWVSIGHWFDQ